MAAFDLFPSKHVLLLSPNVAKPPGRPKKDGYMRKTYVAPAVTELEPSDELLALFAASTGISANELRARLKHSQSAAIGSKAA